MRFFVVPPLAGLLRMTPINVVSGWILVRKPVAIFHLAICMPTSFGWYSLDIYMFLLYKLLKNSPIDC
jgi:hypothetical protein